MKARLWVVGQLVGAMNGFPFTTESDQEGFEQAFHAVLGSSAASSATSFTRTTADGTASTLPMFFPFLAAALICKARPKLPSFASEYLVRKLVQIL
jgi:hypothetical protein